MKKIFASILSVLAVSAVCGTSAFAAEEENVFVTIADANGDLVLAVQSITVTDVDGDGTLTINDALYTAHETYYDGGAKAGYASAETEYGKSITKLWGTEQGSGYGYYVNHKSAMSLDDPLSHDAVINAFVFTDTTNFSDTYCYFNADGISVIKDTEITLTLNAAAYDENWNPIVVPVEGATITIDGEKTDFVTDAQGMARIRLEKEGEVIISAVSDTQTLVPPACKARVVVWETTPTESTAAPTEATSATTETTAAPTTATTASSAAATTAVTETNADTSDPTNLLGIGAVAAAALGALAVTRRRNAQK